MSEITGHRALSWAGSVGAVSAAAALISAVVVGTAGGQEMPAAAPKSCAVACPAARQASTTSAPAPVQPASRAVATTSSTGVPTTTRVVPAVSAPAPWTNPVAGARLAAPIVGATSGNHGGELLMVGSDGGVFPVGQAGFYGSLSGQRLFGPVTAVATDPATGGYWMAGADGGVFAFHSWYGGGLSSHRLAAPIISMAATPSGQGYWLAAADGGVFAFGNAPYRGTLSKVHLSAPIVAMAASPTGLGYWLVAADGGVFAFGDAPYKGTISKVHLDAPIVAIAPTPTGRGYWLAAADGGVFPFGDAGYFGSAWGHLGGASISSIVATADGQGYWLIGQSGSVYAFGDAPRIGESPGRRAPAVVAAARPAASPVRSEVVRYPHAAAGVDLSMYQCHDIPAGPTAVAVVQVTGGSIDGSPNPCYVQQAEWAGRYMSAYIYMDGLPSPAPSSAASGPKGVCAPTDAGCQSWNYGYNWARHWVSYSHSLGVYPRLWWLDIEKYSGWNDPKSNDLVILGALSGLKSMGASPGIYSSAGQWQQITGGGITVPGFPLWVPGAGNILGAGYTATNFCSDPQYGFGGGRVAVVQYGYSGSFPGAYNGAATEYDLDYAC